MIRSSGNTISKVLIGVLFLCFSFLGSISVSALEIPFLDFSLNKIFFLDPCLFSSGNGGHSSVLSSDINPNEAFNENATKIMTALLNAGYSRVEVAGIMGSLKGESGAFNPGEGENAYMGDVSEGNRNFRVTDSQCYNRCGFGIAQWTSGGRQIKLQAYADSQNLPVSSLEAQVGYLIKELGEYGFGPGSFRFGAKVDSAESAAKAAVEVCANYEIPGFSPAEARATCITRGSEAYGRAAYELIGSGRTSGGQSHTSGSFSTVYASDDGFNVTIIGDSITEGAKSEILGLLPEADIHSQSSKQFSTGGAENPSGLSILKDLVDNSNLRKVLVFALGTNDSSSASEENIKKVLDLAGEGTQVVFITNFTRSDDYNFNNNNFMKAANDYDNVSVADWKGAISDNPDQYLISDGIHPNEEGRELFAKLIKDSVSGSVGVSDNTNYEYNNDYCERSPEQNDDKNDDDGCGGGAAIVKTARNLAWSDKNHHNQIKPEFAKAASDVGLGSFGVNLAEAQDCGHFVAVVVRSSVDKDFPGGGTPNMEVHMNASSDWKEIADEGNESNLRPGDVMVANTGSGGFGSSILPAAGYDAGGHIYIYLGGSDKTASASLGDRTGNLGEGVSFSLRNGTKYRIFRYVGKNAEGDECGDDSTGSLEGDLEKIEDETGHKVGVAVAKPGSKTALTSGSWTGGRAWATINVPLAIATAENGDRNTGTVNDPYDKNCNYEGNMAGAITDAISKSKNCSAWWLWESLGGDNSSAARKVETVLKNGGDSNTNVKDGGNGSDLTASKTNWSLESQAVFASNLAAVASGGVIDDMGSKNSKDRNAGLNVVFDNSISKGGWGSGANAATRQFGIVKLSNGQCVAVAIGADYYDSSFSVLTKIAQALKDNESELPSGQCPSGL